MRRVRLRTPVGGSPAGRGGITLSPLGASHLDDRDSELRKQAIFWLSRSDDSRVLEVLQEIIGGTS